MRNVIAICILSICVSTLYAEDPPPSAFMGYSLIHMPSTKQLDSKTLDVRINHRFGNAKSTTEDYFGFDNGANTQFSGDFGFTENLTVGIARSNEFKTYESRAKYAILKEGKFPFSLSAYGVAGQETTKPEYYYRPLLNPAPATGNPLLDAKIGEYNYYEKELSAAERQSYLGSFLMSKRLNDTFSVQLSPLFVHRNFVKSGLGNDRAGLSVGGRIKLTKRIDISFEGIFTNKRDYVGERYAEEDRQTKLPDQKTLTPDEINSKYNKPSDLPYVYFVNVMMDKPVTYKTVPFSLGLDIEAGGHVFQIFVTNNRTLAQTQLLRGAEYDYSKRDFTFGFNLTRLFWFGDEEKVD